MNKEPVKNAARTLVGLNAKRTALECLRLRGESEAASAVERELEAVELALGTLHADDRYLLTEFFVERNEDRMEKLCRYFGCSESSVYRRKRHAVAELAARLYGTAD